MQYTRLEWKYIKKTEHTRKQEVIRATNTFAGIIAIATFERG